MIKKVLFTATVDSHILAFHVPFLKYFKEHGYEVHVATNGDAKIPYCDVKHTVPFERSPLKLNNLVAIYRLKKIINTEKYEIIHTHTPMGSVVTRLAAIDSRKHGARVVYTAHGFHFFNGAPMLNWVIFYPVEKYLSHYTDALITINKEDYKLAKNRFRTNVYYVPGVGVDESKFAFTMTAKEQKALRASLNIKPSDFVLIFPAEISKRKRQIWLIHALESMLKNHPDIHLLLPGKDSLKGKAHELIKRLRLDDNVHLLGFRNDIPKLLTISDLAVSSAFQEGLPVNIMEAMYAGLPSVVSNCRGNRDLIENKHDGYIIETEDSIEFCKKIASIYKNKRVRNRMSKKARDKIINYLLPRVMEDMTTIYRGLNHG
jgi:glycosyltransferase EpsD